MITNTELWTFIQIIWIIKSWLLIGWNSIFLSITFSLRISSWKWIPWERICNVLQFYNSDSGMWILFWNGLRCFFHVATENIFLLNEIHSSVQRYICKAQNIKIISNLNFAYKLALCYFMLFQLKTLHCQWWRGEDENWNCHGPCMSGIVWGAE